MVGMTPRGGEFLVIHLESTSFLFLPGGDVSPALTPRERNGGLTIPYRSPTEIKGLERNGKSRGILTSFFFFSERGNSLRV